MSKSYPISKGTCASVGYGIKAGPQDMKSQQAWRSGFRTYKYTITFYHQGHGAATMHPTMHGPTTVVAPHTDNTIVGKAAASNELHLLVKAIKAAGLVSALEGTGPFTVFAPTDKAFAKLGKATIATLLANKPLLTKVLEYHVIAGAKLSSTQIKDGLTEKSMEGQQVTFAVDEVNGAMVYMVDEAKVIHANIQASNGIVHIIDKVLLYPGFKLTAASPHATHHPTGHMSGSGSGSGGKGKGGKGSQGCTSGSGGGQYGACSMYFKSQWCSKGKVGSKWISTWGKLDAQAAKNCCVCGGGTKTVN